MTAILFCFIFTPSRGEYNVIVRDSEPIRLLESPRSLSVYILILYILMSIHLPQLQHPKGVLTTQDTSCITDNVVYYFTCIKRPSIVYIGETGRRLADRFREDRRDVINEKNDLPLPAFFNQANHYHTLKDMKVAVLKAGLANQDYCEQQEKRLISDVELYGSEWP